MQLWQTEVRNDLRQISGGNQRQQSLSTVTNAPKLTLDKAKMRICQKEAVQHQKGILRGNTDTHVASDLEEVKQIRSKHPSSTKSQKIDSTLGTSKKCTRCGKANICKINALHKKQNVLSAIRRDTTVACVCRRSPVHQFPM